MKQSLLICILLLSHICSGQPPTLHALKTMKLVAGNGSSFYMDETPVTYADLYTYVNAGGQKNAYWSYTSYNIPVQPVTGITWYYAVDYCNWRSHCENLTPVYNKTDSLDKWGYPIYSTDLNANGYRLPTAAEFEFAATAGKPINYPWGNEFHDSLANYDTDRGHQSTEWWRLAPVKSQYCNIFGLYNMCGNNWHWCTDWKGNSTNVKNLKGGSWGTVSSELLYSNYASWTSPGNYNYDIGFRCVRSSEHVVDSVIKIDTNVTHSFYKTLYSSPIQPLTQFYDTVFKQRLAQFLGDNYPESIYFKMKVDEQQVLTPYQLADILVESCKKNNINPLFLTAIMISESGFGTVSFPRWYNSPMAFHWQNKLMVNGLPVYESMPGKRNRKYKTLNDGFNAFCKGIRRELYYKAAKKNLDAFHLIYVGYRADEWMNTLARVYRDVAGVRFEATVPATDAGKYIYADWSTLRKQY
jgi:hypothetical protein